MPTFGEVLLDSKPNVSMESLIEGIAEREIEYCLYVRLDDIEELKKKAVKSIRIGGTTVKTKKRKIMGWTFVATVRPAAGRATLRLSFRLPDTSST